MLHFTEVWESEKFQTAKVSFKVIGTGAIRRTAWFPISLPF